MKTALLHCCIWKPVTLLLILLGLVSFPCLAQIDPTDSLPDDPGAISVTTIQNLSFGAFTNNGSGGTISISTSGSRSSSGTIVPLNMGSPYFQAVFDVGAPRGSVISILFGTDALLTGSNGGSMSMHLSGSDPPSPFITIVAQPARTPISISGMLNVAGSAANPPGAYSGTFYITFNHE